MMQPPRLGFLLLLAGMAFVSPKPVQAYMIYDFSSTWQIDNAYQRNIEENRRRYEDLTRNDRKRSGSSSSGRSGSSGSSASSRVARASSPNAHRYTPNAQVRQQINQQMIQTLRQQLREKGRLDARAEQELRRIENTGLIQQLRQALRSDGYEPDSVATAMAYWIVVHYGISQQMDLASLRGHALARQLRESLAGDSDMVSKSAAEKQRMAETLYWVGSLQMAQYLEAVQTGNRREISRLANESRISLSQTGVQNHIRNGSNGIEIGG